MMPLFRMRTLIFIFILQIGESISLASLLVIGFIRVSAKILENIYLFISGKSKYLSLYCLLISDVNSYRQES